MATQTPNFSLRKPAPSDAVNVELDIGANMDTIDAALAAKSALSHTHANIAPSVHEHAELVAHEADTTSVHGIVDTANVASTSYVTTAVSTHSADSTDIHGIPNTANLVDNTTLTSAVANHATDTTSIHGVADMAALLTSASHALIDHDDVPGAGKVPVQAAAPVGPDLHDLWVDSDEPALSGGGGATAALTPDTIPASPHADSYEFDGSGSTLPTGWAWVNQGSSTYVEGSGVGKVYSPGAAVWSLSLIKRAIPAAGSWTATAKISGWTEGTSANTSGLGLWLRESSSGRLISLHWDQGKGAEATAINNWTSPTAFSSLVASGQTGQLAGGRYPTYFRIRKNSGTSFDFHVSPDGVSWYPTLTAHNPTAWMTPNEIGFGPIQSTASGTRGGEAACWFMRFV